MDNRDNDNSELIEHLNAIIASVYSGGNSWAARKARAEIQDRDDEGKFAEMNGRMRLVMLENGIIPVSFVATLVASSGENDGTGWFYIAPGNPDAKPGFYRYPIGKASGGSEGRDIVAVLPDAYLAGKGIDRNNPSTFADYPSIDSVEYQEAPPGFIQDEENPNRFDSEDGDITIEMDNDGLWEVSDNIDPANRTERFEDLADAFAHVAVIDKTRANYVPEEGEVVETATPATPVANVPAKPEKMDPAGMTNAELLAEIDEVIAPNGQPKFPADADRAIALQDEFDTRLDLEPEGYEGDWFEDNADFVRDPEKRVEPKKVAEIPADVVKSTDTKKGTTDADSGNKGPVSSTESGGLPGGLGLVRREDSLVDSDGNVVANLIPHAERDSVLAEKGIPTPDLFEVVPGNEALFYQAITDASKSNAYGSSLYIPDSPSDYEGTRLFMTEDGLAGVGVTGDGDIISVFRHENGIQGVARTLVANAVANGGYHLDAYDTVLPKIYAKEGFIPLARVAFDGTFVPDWDRDLYKDFNNGEPDVVFMAYDPSRLDGEYTPLTEPHTPDYGAAIDKSSAILDDYLVNAGIDKMVNTTFYGQGRFDNVDPATARQALQDAIDKANAKGATDTASTFDVKSDADLLTGDVAEKIVDFISRGDEQATDTVGNLSLSTDIVDGQMQWIVSYEDANGDTREFVGNLPIDTAGNILQSVDVRADVLAEIESQSKEMDATPAGDIQSPVEILRDPSIVSDMALFIANAGDGVFDSIRGLNVSTSLDGEGMLTWTADFTSPDGVTHEYSGNFQLNNAGEISLPNNTTLEAEIRKELEAQLDAEARRIIQGQRTPINVPATPTSPTADSDRYLNQIEQLIQQYVDEGGTSEGIEQGFARVRKLMGDVQNMKQVIWQQLEAAEATGDVTELTRLRQRFGMLSAAEAYVASHLAEEIDFDLAPNREYILENMALTNVIRDRNGIIKQADATYLAPNGISYILRYDFDRGKVSARVENFGNFDATEEMVPYIKTEEGFRNAGYLDTHSGVGAGKDEPDETYSDLFPIPVHDESGVPIITPSYITIDNNNFKTLGSALHVMMQAMVEANGNIYRHSAYLLAAGRRTVIRLNGQDPKMAPYNMREKVLQALGAPTAELLESLGFNGQLNFDDGGNASDTWWGDFDRTINQPLNALARFFKEKYGFTNSGVSGVDYPSYLEEYIQNYSMEEFEFFSILDKFHELNYEGRDVDGFVDTARQLANELERSFGYVVQDVDIESGGIDGDTYVSVRIDAQVLIDNLRKIADALANGRLGEETIERVDLVGNTVLRYEGENVFVTEGETSVIPSPPAISPGGRQLNNPITPVDVRVARLLDDLSEDELKDAIKNALQNAESSIVTDKYSLPVHVFRNALALRGVDADMFLAKVVDESYGGGNEDALKEYRQEYADVLREGTSNIVRPAGDGIGPAEFDTPEDFDIRMAVRRLGQETTVDMYRKALALGDDSVEVLVSNYDNDYQYGRRYVSAPLSIVREVLVMREIDVDSIENEFKKNDDVKTTLAENNDITVDEATPTRRTDWRTVIRLGSEEYNFIVFTDKKGSVQRFERYDGKWKNIDESNGKGITDDQMVRKIERNADRSLEILIDSGFVPDEDGTGYDETKYVFSFGDDSDNVAEVTGDTAIALDAWRHVTGGDLEALKALEEAGVNVNIMDFIEEKLGGERRGDENDELVVQSIDWTGIDGTKYRYEVVVTRTPDEYFYTYVRQINLTKNTAQSASVGRISQSAYAVLNAHQGEMRKFVASFYTSAGPQGWFAGNATGRRRKDDIFNEDTNSWMHQKEMKTNPQLLANLRRLLGEETASDVDVRTAQNALMKDIVTNLARYRYNERRMRMAAEHITKRHGVMVTPEYMYKVADAYDAHARNQNNLDTFGTWISGDQRTPLDAGDRVQHVSGRLGTVRKRLGWVDSLGRYRYTDYVEVVWDETAERGSFISWTTSRNNTLLQTADGTDGSERVTYNTNYEDPRAGYGTDVVSSEQVPVPPYQHVVAPPIVDGLDYVTVSRDENSNLVLPNGVVIPEAPVGAEIDVKRAFPNTLQEGDFIFVLNGDLETVSAPIVQYGVDGAPEGGIAHNVAIRHENGSYTVRTIVYPESEMGTTVSAHSFFYPNQQADGPSPAQLNEILELLGTKDLPNRPQFGVMNYYLGILDGQDMSGIYSAEEVSEIIQELRALPDRNINRAEETARVAQALADLAEREGSANQADSMQTIADASLVVASNGTGDVVETEAPAELTEEQRRANLVERFEKHYTDMKVLATVMRDSRQDFIDAMWDSGEFDQAEVERYGQLFRDYREGMVSLETRIVNPDDFQESVDAMDMDSSVRVANEWMDVLLLQAEVILEQVIPRLATYYDRMTPDLQDEYTILRSLDRESSLTNLRQIQALRTKIEGLNNVISDSYDGQVSPRQQRSEELLEQFKQGYTVFAVANDADLSSPEDSINKVEFITLPNGQKAVLKTFGGDQVSPEEEVQGELTSYRMFEALGVPSLAVAATVLPSGELAVIVEMFEGQTMGRLPQLDVTDVLDNPASPMVALLDTIGGNPDRHSGNYMFSPDFSQMMPIDNGYMYQSMFTTESLLRGILEAKRDRYNRDIDAYERAADPEAARREIRLTYALPKMVADYLLDGDQTYITDENVRTFDERLRSLREMYVSMGMEDVYEDLLKSMNILLGVSP